MIRTKTDQVTNAKNANAGVVSSIIPSPFLSHACLLSSFDFRRIHSHPVLNSRKRRENTQTEAPELRNEQDNAFTPCLPKITIKRGMDIAPRSAGLGLAWPWQPLPGLRCFPRQHRGSWTGSAPRSFVGARTFSVLCAQADAHCSSLHARRRCQAPRSP